MGDTDKRMVCVIHFDGKSGPEKRLTNDTLKTISLKRMEWLDLPDNECNVNQKNIANRSFEFIPEHVKNVDELHEPAFYHMSCYRSFTDVTKLQRAKKIIEKGASADFPDSSAQNEVMECNSSKDTIRRSRKRRDLNCTKDDNLSTRRSSHVLPECCILCKEAGPIYVTDPVSI